MVMCSLDISISSISLRTADNVWIKRNGQGGRLSVTVVFYATALNYARLYGAVVAIGVQ
jgi:hypothetical protein